MSNDPATTTEDSSVETRGPGRAPCPSMLWSQTYTTVHVTLHGPLEVPPSCTIAQQELHFVRRVSDTAAPVAKIDARLFGAIDEAKTVVRTLPTGTCEVRMVKERPGEWTSLFEGNLYRRLLKVDWARWDLDAEVSSEDDEQSDDGMGGMPPGMGGMPPGMGGMFDNLNMDDLQGLMSKLGGDSKEGGSEDDGSEDDGGEHDGSEDGGSEDGGSDGDKDEGEDGGEGHGTGRA